ncbi:MAG: hypothetical protein IJ588_03765 [Prevotella sp.]|nr:hypothetical protein [Prevotella sp.]
MSTEVIDTNLELMHLDLVTFINDEPLDMLDEFTDEEIASEVISIARRLMHRDFCNGHLTKKGHPMKDYIYSINNKYKGFVSVTNDDGETGVSRTEYKPFYTDDPEDGAFVGLCSLASMLNEAWYHCNN